VEVDQLAVIAREVRQDPSSLAKRLKGDKATEATPKGCTPTVTVSQQFKGRRLSTLSLRGPALSLKRF